MSLYKSIDLWLKFRLKSLSGKKHLAEFDELRGKKKCFVFLAADYGNLGDVAITYAQEKLLNYYLEDYEIVDVPISKTLSCLRAIKNMIESDDIVTITGGGNMMDMYFDIELLRQLVIRSFPGQQIISFPQTVSYSNSLLGKVIEFQAIRTYQGHRNLTLLAREEISYRLMRSIYTANKIKLMPDIVMTLDQRVDGLKRGGVTFCVRNDLESNISPQQKEELINHLSEKFSIEYYDTHINRGGLSIEERKEELERIWRVFQRSEWVITDRLHGMIFAFITCTPAIVFSNSNFKIKGCYQWISESGFIHFLDSFDIDAILSIMQEKQDFFAFSDIHSRIIKEYDDLFRC